MKQKFKTILFSASLLILGGVIAIYFQTKAGSLTPPGSPNSTMFSLEDIAGSGFSTERDSLKQIKSALLTGERGSSLGSDMWTNYFDKHGLFTAHSNTCDSGTEAFVEIKSGSGLGYCIEKNERAAQPWENATFTCINNGKRLPEPREWKFACQNAGVLGLSNMTDNWEWASNFSFPLFNSAYYGVGVATFGKSGCGYAGWDWIGTNAAHEYNYNFRCVR